MKSRCLRASAEYSFCPESAAYSRQVSAQPIEARWHGECRRASTCEVCAHAEEDRPRLPLQIALRRILLRQPPAIVVRIVADLIIELVRRGVYLQEPFEAHARVTQQLRL